MRGGPWTWGPFLYTSNKIAALGTRVMRNSEIFSYAHSVHKTSCFLSIINVCSEQIPLGCLDRGLFIFSQNKYFVAIDSTFCSPQCRTGPSVNSTRPREQLL